MKLAANVTYQQFASIDAKKIILKLAAKVFLTVENCLNFKFLTFCKIDAYINQNNENQIYPDINQ